MLLERLALDLDHPVAVEPRDVFVQQLTAELPEARVLERVTHGRGEPPRVVTFALWSEER